MRRRLRVLCVLCGIAAATCTSGKLKSIASDAGIDPPAADGGLPIAAPDCAPRCPPPQPTPIERIPAPNPIPAENALPGHADWWSGMRANNREVEVYASAESVRHGDRLGVKVSTSEPAQVTAELYRIGHYGGAGARRVWSGGPFETARQPECPRDAVTSRVECNWTNTFELAIDASWPSGLYVVKIRRGDFKRFYPFAIRDRRAAELLYTPNFTTYQAYNNWGGEGLYYDGSGTMPSGKAWEVSFDRPYLEIDGAGKTFLLDLELVQLLEREGYDVTYGSQLDFVRHNDFLTGIGALVHGAQDEYWTVEERAQVDVALAAGGTSLVYFGGNGAYWRIRLTSDARGTPLRTIVCYKSDSPTRDPIPGSTMRFRDPPAARPENNLFGVMYEGWQLIPFPLIVGDPSHWLFEGTGVTAGTQFVDLVGFEYDHAFRTLPGYPANVKVVMQSPVVSAEGIPSVAHTVERTLPSGTLVFSAGTIWWPRALSDDPKYHDTRIERATLNVLERALTHRRAPRSLDPIVGQSPARPTPEPVWAKAVTAFAGVAGSPGLENGPADVARFRHPTGIAAAPNGDLFVADTGNNVVRVVLSGAQGTLTVAGNGELGYRDGDGATAMFRMPTDVAVGPAGEIYVADSDNHVIRKIERTPTGWSVSTVAGEGFSAGYADGVGTDARFSRPTSIAVDAVGNIYVADQENHRIRMIRFDTREVVTLAGSGAEGTTDSALGTLATFHYPSGIEVAPTGELYVIEGGAQLVRRISAGIVRSVDTVAGTPSWDPFGFADGAGHEARFRLQMGIAFSPEGDLLIADTGNFRIRKVRVGVDATTSRVYTVAGTGEIGTRLGTGHASDIVAPTGVAFGPNQVLYVSDSYNHVIRAVER